MDFLHPDYGIVARKMYKYDADSYAKITEYHQTLRKAGVPYWITVWDDMLRIIARIRTWEYKKANPDKLYPKKEGKE